MRDVVRIFWRSKARFCWKHKTKQWKRFFLIKEKKIIYTYNIYIYVIKIRYSKTYYFLLFWQKNERHTESQKVVK